MTDDPHKKGRHNRSDIRMHRALDLFWAEDLALRGAAPAAPSDLDVDVELVALEIAGVPLVSPGEGASPGEAAGPFIEAQLVKPPATDAPAPFIEAVLITKQPVREPPPVAVGDWLGDVVPPAAAIVPPPSTAATPDWL